MQVGPGLGKVRCGSSLQTCSVAFVSQCNMRITVRLLCTGTSLRDCARILASECLKRVIIVDTSNEIGGDGDIPHPSITTARRMQVSSRCREPALHWCCVCVVMQWRCCGRQDFD